MPATKQPPTSPEPAYSPRRPKPLMKMVLAKKPEERKTMGSPHEEATKELSYKPERGFKLDGMFAGQVKQPWDRAIQLFPYEEFSAKGMKPIYRLDWMAEIPNNAIGGL